MTETQDSVSEGDLRRQVTLWGGGEEKVGEIAETLGGPIIM